MNHAKLLTRGTVDILCHVAIVKVYLLGIVVEVVCDVHDASALINNKGTVPVVHVLRALSLFVFKILLFEFIELQWVQTDFLRLSDNNNKKVTATTEIIQRLSAFT